MRARTRALVGTPLRRLWRRKRRLVSSSSRTDTDLLRNGPIATHQLTRARRYSPHRGKRLTSSTLGVPHTRGHLPEHQTRYWSQFSIILAVGKVPQSLRQLYDPLPPIRFRCSSRCYSLSYTVAIVCARMEKLYEQSFSAA